MMPALVVPAVATTPTTSSDRGWWASTAAQPRAGQAVVLGGDDERFDADDMERLADRRVGLVAYRDERAGRPDPAPPVTGRIAGHDERREIARRTSGHEASACSGGKARCRVR